VGGLQRGGGTGGSDRKTLLGSFNCKAGAMNEVKGDSLSTPRNVPLNLPSAEKKKRGGKGKSMGRGVAVEGGEPFSKVLKKVIF